MNIGIGISRISDKIINILNHNLLDVSLNPVICV